MRSLITFAIDALQIPNRSGSATGGRPTTSRGSPHIVEAREVPVTRRRYSREQGREAVQIVHDDHDHDDANFEWVRKRENAPRRERRQSVVRPQNSHSKAVVETLTRTAEACTAQHSPAPRRPGAHPRARSARDHRPSLPLIPPC